MFWILFIVGLLGTLGDGKAETRLMNDQYERLKEIVPFFNNLFISGGSVDHPKYMYGELVDVPGQLSGKVKIGVWKTLTLNNNAKISYPDSNTKLCTMDVISEGPISLEYIDSGLKLNLSGCGLLLQFSVSNKTGVDIKPEAVLAYGCSAVQDDGSLVPWSYQLTQGLSRMLMESAQSYFTNHYNSTEPFSYKYFNQGVVTAEVFHDVFNTISILI